VTTAKVEPLIREGINPNTGQSVTEQASFGYTGVPNDSGQIELYPSITLGLVGLPDDEIDIFELSQQVHQRVDELNARLSDGYQLVVSADFTDAIDNQISSLQNNVLTGIMAITVISVIMISWRVSLLTAFFMVAVITTTIGILFGLGYTLNTITLFALVLALGLFVDDATIISEAIDAEKKSSVLSSTNIVRRAIRRVGAASLAGSLTTILVFVPLLFIGGILGEFIFFLPLTIIIALLVSYLLSLTLLPFLSRFSILTKRGRSHDRRWQNPVPDWLAGMIMLLKRRPALGRSLAVGMVLLSFGFVGASGYFAQKLSFNIFPSSKDSDELIVSIVYPPATSIEQADATAADVLAQVGDVLGRDALRVSFGRNGQPNTQQADALVELTSFRQRDTTSIEYIARLKRALADYDGAKITLNQIDAGPPTEEFPFKMQIFGEDRAQIMAAANTLATDLDGTPIELANGSSAHITATDIGGVSTLNRTDGKQYVQVLAGYDSSDTSALVQATEAHVKSTYSDARLAAFGLDQPDLGFDFGQESANEESFAALGPAGLIAVAAMFVLLAFQFRSVLKPILIFVALPFSLLGVTWGLYVSANPLSFFVMVGFIGLVGIAVNNTIMLTDFANQERRAGADPVTAIANATRRRFRPLFTTTATTVAALAPLAMSDPFWEPLALTIMFGLLSSTLLVIISFPYYYLVEEWISRKFLRVGSWAARKVRRHA
jgi:multidrug efflux pump subunit AcrB